MKRTRIITCTASAPKPLLFRRSREGAVVPASCWRATRIPTCVELCIGERTALNCVLHASAQGRYYFCTRRLSAAASPARDFTPTDVSKRSQRVQSCALVSTPLSTASFMAKHNAAWAAWPPLNVMPLL